MQTNYLSFEKELHAISIYLLINTYGAPSTQEDDQTEITYENNNKNKTREGNRLKALCHV